jgi:hypothetical protein
MDEVSFVLGFDVGVVNNDAVGLLTGFIPVQIAAICAATPHRKGNAVVTFAARRKGRLIRKSCSRRGAQCESVEGPRVFVVSVR